MKLYVATSVYQFINSITMELPNQGQPQADLLVLKPLIRDNFDLKKLEEAKVFHRVYDWNGDIEKFCTMEATRTEYVKNVFYKLGMAAGVNKLARTLPNYGKTYDEICVFYLDFPTRLAYKALKNEHTVMSFGEEGTYTYNCFKDKTSFARKVLYYLFFGEDSYDNVTKAYVYRPEMMNLYGRDVEVGKIQPQVASLRNLILNIYKKSVDGLKAMDRKVIMFDQTMGYTDQAGVQNRIARTIMNVAGKENCIVKMHPCTIDSPYDGDVPTFYDKCPFEIVLSLMDVEDKILISNFSTTCVTPKTMLDVEPVVIFTYLLFDKDKPKYPLVQDLENNYRDRSRVIIPKTMEELEDVLKHHLEKS